MLKRVDISMVVMCYASDVIEYDIRRAESNATPHEIRPHQYREIDP